MWLVNALPCSTTARNAKYAFLKGDAQRHALNVALICTVVTSLSLATIIVLTTEALRRRAISTAKVAA